MSKKNIMEKRPRQWLIPDIYAAIVGIILVAVCCFATILIATVGVAGLSALTPYFYYVLFPALAVLLILIYLSYRKWKKLTKKK